jgi:hypothetical protein
MRKDIGGAPEVFACIVPCGGRARYPDLAIPAADRARIERSSVRRKHLHTSSSVGTRSVSRRADAGMCLLRVLLARFAGSACDGFSKQSRRQQEDTTMANNRNDNRGNPDQPRDEEGRFTEDDGGMTGNRGGRNEQAGRGSNEQSGRGNEQSGRGNQGGRGNPDQPRDEEGRFTEDDDGSTGGRSGMGQGGSGSGRGGGSQSGR